LIHFYKRTVYSRSEYEDLGVGAAASVLP